MPAYCTAMGKLLLANLPEQPVNAVVHSNLARTYSLHVPAGLEHPAGLGFINGRAAPDAHAGRLDPLPGRTQVLRAIPQI